MQRNMFDMLMEVRSQHDITQAMEDVKEAIAKAALKKAEATGSQENAQIQSLDQGAATQQADELRRPLGTALRQGRQEQMSEQRRRRLDTLSNDLAASTGSGHGGSRMQSQALLRNVRSARGPGGQQSTGRPPVQPVSGRQGEEPVHVIHRHHHHHYHHHYYPDAEAPSGARQPEMQAPEVEGQTTAGPPPHGAAASSITYENPADPDQRHLHYHYHSGETEIPPRAQRLLGEARRTQNVSRGAEAADTTVATTYKRPSIKGLLAPETRLPRLG